MNLQEFHDKHLLIIRRIYEAAGARGERDFDAIPTLLFAVDGAVGAGVLHDDGSPFDAAAAFLKQLPTQPDMVSFMAPAWRKDPVTFERNGEGVIVVTESAFERVATMFELSREPLTLTEKTPDDGMIHTRLNLLYQPTSPTEH